MIKHANYALHIGMIGLSLIASIIIILDKKRFRYELFFLILAYFLYVILF